MGAPTSADSEQGVLSAIRPGRCVRAVAVESHDGPETWGATEVGDGRLLSWSPKTVQLWELESEEAIECMSVDCLRALVGEKVWLRHLMGAFPKLVSASSWANVDVCNPTTASLELNIATGWTASWHGHGNRRVTLAEAEALRSIEPTSGPTPIH